MRNALIWMGFNILSIIIMSFYSMMEMACVSFNRARLQYYVSKGEKRAIWLNFLLHNPARLFGTTLIAVDVALMIGSECSRQFHLALGINPDLAPLWQVIIVVIFGELAPMFAARRYPEHVAMMGVPIVYISAKIMQPIIWILGAITRSVNRLVGGQRGDRELFIGRDELQKMLEEQDDEHPAAKGSTEEFNDIVSNIFSLREKEAMLMMEPLKSVQMLASNSTVGQMHKIIEKTMQTYVPIYHQTPANIIGIAIPRDLIRIPDNRRLRDYARPPWFITRKTKALQIIKQFRSNKQRVAIVLDDTGQAAGILTLDDVLEEIFGKIKISKEQRKVLEKQKWQLIDKTFPGDTKVSDFNKQYNVTLGAPPEETLAEVITKSLGHHPERGESIYIEPFEITVKDTSLLEIKTVSIKTKML